MSDNTRRDFLKSLALVPLAAVPVLTESALDSVNFTDLDFAPLQLPAYGPAERTAIIDKWISRLDEALITLEKYYGFLIDARGLPPGQVDGVQLVNLENDVHAICDGMTGYIDCDYEHNIITAATGRYSGAVCVEAELMSDSHVFDRAFWQREVDAVSEDHPAERARLQALLEARYEGVL